MLNTVPTVAENSPSEEGGRKKRKEIEGGEQVRRKLRTARSPKDDMTTKSIEGF